LLLAAAVVLVNAAPLAQVVLATKITIQLQAEILIPLLLVRVALVLILAMKLLVDSLIL
jgi:hypothetical protein